MLNHNPLLITVAFSVEARLFFNHLRQKHFPAERNYLDAHLMLFHNLPIDESAIPVHLKNVAGQTEQFTMDVSNVVNIGTGVAFKLESAPLSSIHRQLQERWQQWLIPQDKQKLWPHITVQNKVEPLVAKTLAKELSEEFEPFTIIAQGFQLWEYKGGPWEFLSQFDFNQSL